MNTKGAPFCFLSTRWNCKRKRGYLSFEVITKNLAGNVAHPFLTSQTDVEPPETPGGSCMMPLSGLVEVALFSNPAACFSSSGQQEYHIGAGLTWEETKGPPSELQGQFTAPDAAIHSWRHLVHTSAPHSSSSGCERMLEHTAHFSSFSINWLFMLAKAGSFPPQRSRCHTNLLERLITIKYVLE
ncbi:hypothetical protein EMCRGX_G012345 [Ephydatia muelleri]